MQTPRARFGTWSITNHTSMLTHPQFVHTLVLAHVNSLTSSRLGPQTLLYNSPPLVSIIPFRSQAETAFALVYAYGLGWPALIWVALRYYGLEEWSMVEAIAVWGYGQFVWIPASVRCHLISSPVSYA